MKLLKLAVRNFQCIETADVELGPRLNVLYGPNDLGKSSLAWAIRAVLLLQHGSSHAERFASWYGADEPKVQLTFEDDDQKCWRVTKAFGGTAGRSHLEYSKDGVTFTSEAKGREVDERVRALLRWGVPPAGARGRQPFPESFLSQVLLAEQAEDSVRKILLEARLEHDADESGRVRLIEALGALAQDPLFKHVLDEATAKVDEAYTPKGSRRRGAGSPWVEQSERVVKLRQDEEELERQERESVAVEEKLRKLRIERDDLHGSIIDAQGRLETARRELRARQERDLALGELRAREQQLRALEVATGRLVTLTAELETLAGQTSAAVELMAKVEGVAAEADRAVHAARAGLDTAVHADPDATRREQDLVEQVTAAAQAVQAAEVARAAATTAASRARDVAERLRDADEAARTAAHDATVAETAAGQAARDVVRAEEVREAARQRLRDARSGDDAQARALRRQELDNRALSMASRRAQLEARRQRAHDAGVLSKQAVAAEEAGARTLLALEVARRAAEEDSATLARLENARALIGQLRTFVRHRAIADELATAERARAVADGERGRAMSLRNEARAIQAPGDLPAAERIAELRALHERLRVAEARLGGGMSLTVRPRRPLTVRATVDGTSQAEQRIGEPLTLSAGRDLTLSIDELVELELIAGEASARRDAAELRDRWRREGESTLRAHGAATVDDLAAQRLHADTALRRQADLLRDAEIADARAAASEAADVDSLRARLAALEAELGEVDRGDLASRLSRLPAPLDVALQTQLAEVVAGIESRRGQLELKRTAVTRAEAQHEVQLGDVARARAQARDAERELGGPCTAILAVVDREVLELDEDIAAVATQIVGLANGTSEAESSAAAALVAAEATLDAARTTQFASQQRAQVARDRRVQADTRREEVVELARQLDPDGAWRVVLGDGGVALPTEHLDRATASAGERWSAARTARDAAEAALSEYRREREATIRALRAAVETAERGAIAARAQRDEVAARHRELRDRAAAVKDTHAEVRVSIAGIDVDAARQAASALTARVRMLDPQVGTATEASVAALEKHVETLVHRRHELDGELARGQGALEQVGGAIVRERLAELRQAKKRAEQREHEITVAFEAWKLLQMTLRESESSESAHLGRALAAPVSARFHQLTSGRYGGLELGAQLEPDGILVNGERRELRALSAGTQDQLATLLRLCIAQQLRSTIVLDDHLSQSDGARVAWFNTMLRDATDLVQVVIITCRPQELLLDGEPAGADAPMRDSGRVRAVDLSRIIRRFPASSRSRSMVP